jgi:hypothetical protein
VWRPSSAAPDGECNHLPGIGLVPAPLQGFGRKAELDPDRAEDLLRSDDHFIAPNLVIAEITNATWKFVIFDSVSAAAAISAVREVAKAFEQLVPTRPLPSWCNRFDGGRPRSALPVNQTKAPQPKLFGRGRRGRRASSIGRNQPGKSG